MPRVIGIDIGTISVDICGLADGRVIVAESLPTTVALADPRRLVDRLAAAGPFDLAVVPAGYGLPLRSAPDTSEADLRLAALAADGEAGGIDGFRAFLRAWANAPFPVVYSPGVIHLSSVPAHRKINRVDMGTADKVCACALAIHEDTRRKRCLEEDVSLFFVELGGAFSAVLAVSDGQIVDGLGGTSGPMGMAAAGALDGEVAFLAGSVTKQMLFAGGAAAVSREAFAEDGLPDRSTAAGLTGWNAYAESIAKAVASLAVVVPGVRDVVLSGRHASNRTLQEDLVRRLAPVMGKLRLHDLRGYVATIKQGAQGAALIADGLAGGAAQGLVDTLGLRAAAGSVLDHLHVIGADTARRRLGLA